MVCRRRKAVTNKLQSGRLQVKEDIKPQLLLEVECSDGRAFILPHDMYNALSQAYTRAMVLKVFFIIASFILCVIGSFLKSTDAGMPLGIACIVTGCLGLLWQALTLPTGMLHDRTGNTLDLYSGIVYLAQEPTPVEVLPENTDERKEA